MFQIKYKAIGYAYPYSTNAEDLGFGDSGCFYVKQTAVIEDGSFKSFIAHNCEGFEQVTDDLIALYHEYEGEKDPYFQKYAKPEILERL